MSNGSRQGIALVVGDYVEHLEKAGRLQKLEDKR
jgi:hypothetical protein